MKQTHVKATRHLFPHVDSSAVLHLRCSPPHVLTISSVYATTATGYIRPISGDKQNVQDDLVKLVIFSKKNGITSDMRKYNNLYREL